MKVVRTCGRNFTSLSAAWTYIMTLTDERRYQALSEISTQLVRHFTEVDDWVEAIYTEVERLRRGTVEWKEKDF